MAPKSTDWSPLAGGTLFERAGRAIALMGVALPLLLIGHSKFAVFEVEALKPLIGGTPWLAWMYAVSGPGEVSRFLGVIEIATALLLMASPWMPRAGVVGGVLGVDVLCHRVDSCRPADLGGGLGRTTRAERAGLVLD